MTALTALGAALAGAAVGYLLADRRSSRRWYLADRARAMAWSRGRCPECGRAIATHQVDTVTHYRATVAAAQQHGRPPR